MLGSLCTTRILKLKPFAHCVLYYFFSLLCYPMEKYIMSVSHFHYFMTVAKTNVVYFDTRKYYYDLFLQLSAVDETKVIS